MRDTGYEQIEARLSALESAVWPGRSVQPRQRPIQTSLETARVPPAPEQGRSHQRPGEGRSLETLLAGRGMQFAGLLLILFGAGFFFDLAATRGWIGPAERILIGLGAGTGLIVFAATRIAYRYRGLAEALIGLGGGILYLSLWASVRLFPDLNVSRAAAFAAMIAVTALLTILAQARRSERIAFLGAIGGYLTPLLLANGPVDHAMLAAYVILLTGALLGLAARYAFNGIEVLAFFAAVAYAPAFAPDPLHGWSLVSAQIVAALSFLMFAFAYSVASGATAVRREALLATSIGAYIATLELLLYNERTTLSCNLFALAALLLAAAHVRKWPAAIVQTYGYAAVASVSLALIALLHGLALGDALTIEAIVLTISGQRLQNRTVIGSGLALFGFTGIALIFQAVSLPPAEGLQMGLSFVLWLAGSAVSMHRNSHSAIGAEAEPLVNVARISVDIVAVVGISRACLDLLGGSGWNLAVPSFAEFGISVAWCAYATALLAYGLRHSRSLLRWEALALFAVTIVKVFTVDLATIDLEYRIASFVGLGVALFAVSAWYTRCVTLKPGAAE